MRYKKYLLFFIFIVFCELISSCKFIQKKQEERVLNLENMVAQLEDEFIPVKFKIQKNKKGEALIKILFLDLCGDKIKEGDLSLIGDEIYFDFQVVKLSDGKNISSKELSLEQYMFFPYKIYSEYLEPANGIDLCNFYDSKNFPLIYTGFENYLIDSNKKYEKSYSEKISQTFSYIVNGDLEKLSNQFGSAVHDIQGIYEFKSGYTYSIVCHTHTGGIEIRSE